MIDFGKKLPLRHKIRSRLMVASFTGILTISNSVFADSDKACFESVWDVVRDHFTGITKPNYKYRCLTDKYSRALREDDKKYFESQDTDQIFRAKSTQKQKGTNALDLKILRTGAFEMGHNLTTTGSDREDNVIESVNGYTSVSKAKQAK